MSSVSLLNYGKTIVNKGSSSLCPLKSTVLYNVEFYFRMILGLSIIIKLIIKNLQRSTIPF